MAWPVPRHGPTSGGLPGREPCQGTGTGQKGAPCGACPSSQHRHRSGPEVTSTIRGREGLQDSHGSEGSRLSQTAASFKTSGIFPGDTGSNQGSGKERDKLRALPPDSRLGEGKEQVQVRRAVRRGGQALLRGDDTVRCVPKAESTDSSGGVRVGQVYNKLNLTGQWEIQDHVFRK